MFLKKVLAIISVAFVICLANAQGMFNENLSEEDYALVKSGQTLIKNTANYRKLCLKGGKYGADKALKAIEELKPTYFAEVIHEYPYKGNENLIDEFESLILDIPSYAGIPYWSVKWEKFYDLYDEAKVVSIEKNGNRTTILADIIMDPFDYVPMRIDSEKGPDWFYYESTNLNVLEYYEKFKCVNPENMKSIIFVCRDGDRWIMYGAGAVKAPSIFFLRDRVDASFMGRIKTFCGFFFDKIKK